MIQEESLLRWFQIMILLLLLLLLKVSDLYGVDEGVERAEPAAATQYDSCRQRS